MPKRASLRVGSFFFYLCSLNVRLTMNTTFLKDCLADALIALLEDRRLEEINIQDIAEKAGYHRASWFRNFKSKREAVTYKMVRLWDNWTATHAVTVKDEFTLDNAVTFFQYNYEICDTLRLLNKRGLMPEVQESFIVILYERHHDDAERSYANAIYANALFGVLKEWVLRDFKETPEQMADIVSRSFSQ